MINLSMTLGDGKEMLSLALSDDDIEALKQGKNIVIRLTDVGIGFWRTGQDGSRSFIQPRDSRVVLLNANSMIETGDSLGLNLGAVDELVSKQNS